MLNVFHWAPCLAHGDRRSTTPTVEVAEVKAKMPWPRPYSIILDFDILASAASKILATTSASYNVLGLNILASTTRLRSSPKIYYRVRAEAKILTLTPRARSMQKYCPRPQPRLVTLSSASTSWSRPAELRWGQTFDREAKRNKKTNALYT